MRYRHSKYNAKKTVVDGITFDSQKEARRYGELKILQKAGKITALKVHPVYSIDIEDCHICNVELDFSYKDDWLRKHNEDVKGRDLPMSRLKRKLLSALYGITVELT